MNPTKACQVNTPTRKIQSIPGLDLSIKSTHHLTRLLSFAISRQVILGDAKCLSRAKAGTSSFSSCGGVGSDELNKGSDVAALVAHARSTGCMLTPRALGFRNGC